MNYLHYTNPIFFMYRSELFKKMVARKNIAKKKKRKIKHKRFMKCIHI